VLTLELSQQLLKIPAVQLLNLKKNQTRGKIYKITTNYIKMSIKYTNISHCKAPQKFYSNSDFLV
jgi:hypothetical protein